MAVYKDKKRGTWYVSLYYTDWTGKQQRKLERGFSTKKEAQDWERHFSLEKASSLDMTFGDFYKRYTDDVKLKLRENTWKSKEYVIELKILPFFKDLVMREITPRDVIAWQNEMRKCESQDGEKYKGTYLRKMQAELSAIFNHAVHSGSPEVITAGRDDGGIHRSSSFLYIVCSLIICSDSGSGSGCGKRYHDDCDALGTCRPYWE